MHDGYEEHHVHESPIGAWGASRQARGSERRYGRAAIVRITTHPAPVASSDRAEKEGSSPRTSRRRTQAWNLAGSAARAPYSWSRTRVSRTGDGSTMAGQPVRKSREACVRQSGRSSLSDSTGEIGSTDTSSLTRLIAVARLAYRLAMRS
jgi:hypothetical protein